MKQKRNRLQNVYITFSDGTQCVFVGQSVGDKREFEKRALTVAKFELGEPYEVPHMRFKKGVKK